MFASKELEAAFNRQVGRELGASNQYLAIGAYFASEALSELSGFFFRQASEEHEHAMKFVHFLIDAGAEVKIPSVPEPQSGFHSAEEPVQLSLDWEEMVTKQIYELVEIAKKESNYVALRFLDWFVTEQLEEVSSMSELLQVVRRAGENDLLHVEEYLARRKGEASGDGVEA